MTTCQAGPNGSKCHVCVVWDEAMHRVRMANGERENVQFWKNRQHDAMQSTIARLERRLKRLEGPTGYEVTEKGAAYLEAMKAREPQ